MSPIARTVLFAAVAAWLAAATPSSAATDAERAEMQRLGAAFSAALAADTAAYAAELSDIGWFRLISDPTELVGDKGLARARGVVREAHAILAHYRGLYPSRVADERNRIANAALSEETRRATLADFDRGAEQGRATWDRQWALDARFMDEVDAMISLLARNEGFWSIAGDQISFADSNAEADFQAHAANLERIAVQEGLSQRPFQTH
jgi:hypothetical protein